MKAKIYTVYSQEHDMTFIMKEDADNFVSVIGFYFGEPTEENTKEYAGKLKAVWCDHWHREVSE